jgi:hypothetical protein
MLHIIIIEKQGKKPLSTLNKADLEMMWFSNETGGKRAPEDFELEKMWMEDHEEQLQKIKESPQDMKDTMLGRTQEVNVIRFINELN